MEKEAEEEQQPTTTTKEEDINYFTPQKHEIALKEHPCDARPMAVERCP